MSTKADIRQRIDAVLARRFPNNGIAPPHYGELLSEYAKARIGPPHLLEELETGDEGKLWSCIWEAMLYRKLCALGFTPTGPTKRAGQNRPDFRIEHDGRVIWIEAVVPGPQGIPADYLEPPVAGAEVRAKRKPDQERVLRCTSAIADKRLKLDRYREQGIVGPKDCTVIAVNICRLSDWDIDGNGISQFPLSMEAVFPIGPLAVMMSREGKIDGPARHMPRFAIQKASGKEIDTANFLNPTFAGVSALIQAHQNYMYERDLILNSIHNPLATNPLPPGLLQPHKEFVAQPEGNGYRLREIRLEARIRELTDSVRRRFHGREDRGVRQLTPVEAGDFVGERNKCQENVNRWCFMREHFRHLRVTGWLISGDCVLDKHFVVDVGDGQLVDVTPMPDDAKRTFLRHDGTEDEFLAMPGQLILAR